MRGIVRRVISVQFIITTGYLPRRVVMMRPNNKIFTNKRFRYARQQRLSIDLWSALRLSFLERYRL